MPLFVFAEKKKSYFRNRFWPALLLLILPFGEQAQTAKDFGFIAHHFESRELGTVNFYVSDTLHNKPKPLLVYLDGSGDNPLAYFKYDSAGRLLKYSGIPLPLKTLKLRYHILLISKPNVPFAKPFTEQPNNIFDSVYNALAGCDWRVQSASRAIDFVCAHYPVSRNKIIVIGHSEGGSVAPRLALLNRKITHCIAVAGGGLNQFYDPIIQFRIKAEKGEISHQQAQQSIDSLFADFTRIYREPRRTDRFWFGHTYKRWSSFTLTPTVEYLKQLTIPVYIAQCTADENVSVLSADYIRLEFLRLQKTNLTFKNYPQLDHSFRNKRTGEDFFLAAMEEAVKWAENN